MNVSDFNLKYRSVSRPEREQIMCAMIRINYGTPWQGDLERLQKFFPQDFHPRLTFDGLTKLIEDLNPFADEPTYHGTVAEEPTLIERTSTITLTQEITEQIAGASSPSEVTRKLGMV